MNEFTKIEVIKLFYKVIGNIEPKGISEYDELALKNLKLMTDVLYELLNDIAIIESVFENRNEGSIQKIKEHCTKFLNSVGEVYKDEKHI